MAPFIWKSTSRRGAAVPHMISKTFNSSLNYTKNKGLDMDTQDQFAAMLVLILTSNAVKFFKDFSYSR